MSVTERPNFEILVLEAWLARQIRREATADWTRAMPGIDRANVSGWTPMREDDSCRVQLLQMSDFGIEPGNSPQVCLIMRLNIPAVDLEEVVEAEADRLFLFRWDRREETTA